jgi:hypothetical protein
LRGVYRKADFDKYRNQSIRNEIADDEDFFGSTVTSSERSTPTPPSPPASIKPPVETHKQMDEYMNYHLNRSVSLSPIPLTSHLSFPDSIFEPFTDIGDSSLTMLDMAPLTSLRAPFAESNNDFALPHIAFHKDWMSKFSRHYTG